MLSKKYSNIERSIISKVNRFKLSRIEKQELINDFKYSNFLIVGAAGSIGSAFIEILLKYDHKSLILVDKDENQLTELNREINLIIDTKKVSNIKYICSDITSMDIEKLIFDNQITHYLNFAAIKHVRSEEHLESVKYMFNTNSHNFIPAKKIKKNSLKKVFSISTDKVANPTSLLGISKNVMENRLGEFKFYNKKIFVSSVRFANVSFSNGSILKYVDDRVRSNKVFGIPKNIKRYFITHEEAGTLCFKALTEKIDGHILIPSLEKLGRLKNIKVISEKILSYYNYKPCYVTNQKLRKNQIRVYLNNKQTHGQKDYEEFVGKNEKTVNLNNVDNYQIIKLKRKFSTENFCKKVNTSKTIEDVYKLSKKHFKSFKRPKNNLSVSKII